MPSDFTYQPAYGAQARTQPRVRVASFGDGYEQRVADGINTKPATWSLTFANRTTAIIDSIESQLAGYRGVTSFTWTPTGGSEIRVVCREWTRAKTTAGYDSLAATFDQVFEA